MLFDSVVAVLAAVALARQASGSPTLERRATSDPAAWPELHRAAELSSSAYSGCQQQAFDVTITKVINEQSTDTQGYMGYSDTKKRITVAMRGSTSPTDFQNDNDTTPVYPTLAGVNFPSDVRIMHGLYLPWSSVHDEVIAEVQRLVAQYPDYTLESTGHSLGGSLTYMSYIALAQNFPGKEITSNAMAAFPIGNQAFADFGTAQNGTLNRGNNVNDGVPNMYVGPPENFKHYGTEYYSYGTQDSTVKCVGERDTDCSAGNGMVGVTPGHFESFGVVMGSDTCGVL